MFQDVQELRSPEPKLAVLLLCTVSLYKWTSELFPTYCHLIWRLRYHDGNGSKSVAKKVNLCSFNLYRDYFNLLTWSNASQLFWSWIPKNHIQVQKRKTILSCLVYFFLETWNQASPHQWCGEGKEMYSKSVLLMFCLLNLLLFWRSCCCCHCGILNSLFSCGWL